MIVENPKRLMHGSGEAKGGSVTSGSISTLTMTDAEKTAAAKREKAKQPIGFAAPAQPRLRQKSSRGKMKA